MTEPNAIVETQKSAEASSDEEEASAPDLKGLAAKLHCDSTECWSGDCTG